MNEVQFTLAQLYLRAVRPLGKLNMRVALYVAKERGRRI